jgi:seryl-tRNA synthetase
MSINTSTESRRLEVRCGLKSKDQQRKVYVHMLNGTMCATERALCCLVENYQTPDVRVPPDLVVIDPNAARQGLVIPEVLRPYMQGRDFLPWKKALPKNLQRKQA